MGCTHSSGHEIWTNKWCSNWNTPAVFCWFISQKITYFRILDPTWPIRILAILIRLVSWWVDFHSLLWETLWIHHALLLRLTRDNTRMQNRQFLLAVVISTVFLLVKYLNKTLHIPPLHWGFSGKVCALLLCGPIYSYTQYMHEICFMNSMRTQSHLS